MDIDGRLDLSSVSLTGTLETHTISGSLPIGLGISGTVHVYPVYSMDSSLLLPAVDADGSGVVDIVGEIYLSPRLFQITSDGSVSYVGDGSIIIPMFSVEGDTILYAVGDAALTLPLIRLSTTTVLGATGIGTATIPMIRLRTASVPDVMADGVVVIPMFDLLAQISEFTPLTMVLNLRNKGLTEYSNYLFNSMCRFQGLDLGASSTGIYKLTDGERDVDDIINWNIRLGKVNLELTTKKKLKQMWLFAKRDGNLMVTVLLPNGEQFEYDAENYEETEDGVRVKFGKGIRSKYVSMDIRNDDVATIELDAIRLMYMQQRKPR